MSKTHPLEHSWTLWYDSKKTVKGKTKDAKPEHQSADSWEDNLVTIDTVNTVESFWIMLNHIKRPSSLELAANYHFFKKGVKPMWEDPANRDGGKWILQLTTKEDLYRVDGIWEELTMSMIGEYLDEGIPGDQVIGAVLSKRRNEVRVSLWTRDSSAQEAIDRLGARLMEILKVESSKTNMKYLPHAAHPQLQTS